MDRRMADDDRIRSLLLDALDAQRRHVLAAVEGLTDAQLRTAALPSGWSPIGLVRHLTLGGERYWFETVVGGGALDYWPDKVDGSPRPADWCVAGDEAAEAAVVAAIAGCPSVPRSSRLHGRWAWRAGAQPEFLAELAEAVQALPQPLRLILDDVHELVDPVALQRLDLGLDATQRRLQGRQRRRGRSRTTGGERLAHRDLVHRGCRCR